MSDARNHHFVPQGYLRLFADGVGRQARVFTVDRTTGKSFTTQVRNVAAKRDFNRIEAEGVDPNVLEDAFAEFEGEAVAALRRVSDSRSFSEEADRLLVLNLIALLAGRNPRWRGRLDGFLSDIFQSMAEIMVSKQERWEAIGAQVREAEGKDAADETGPGYEEMRDFIKSGKYKISADQNYLIGLENDSTDIILRTLASRKWVLWTTTESAGNFITSDHPVCLIDVSGRKPGFYGIGYGMTETAVLFPISRSAFLVGTFEGEEGVRHASALDVARFNAQIIQHAERQVYAYDDSFQYRKPFALGEGKDLAHDAMFLRAQ